MVMALVLRGHWVHVVVFGLPVAGLAGAIAVQEIRARRGKKLSGVEPLDGRSPHLRAAAAGLVGAAVIHAIVIPEHFREYVAFGVFFSVLTVAQLAVAAIVVYRPDARTVRYVALGSAAVVVLWLVSRTSGVPVGPEQWQPESFGRLDLGATVAELITTVGCAAELWTMSERRRSSIPRSPKLTA